MKLPMLKNSGGQTSASFTMMIIAFICVIVWLILSIFSTIFGIETREFDGASSMMLLTPLYALYFSRRWTSVKNSITVTNEEGQNEAPKNSKK